MKIFVGTDHNGFRLMHSLIDYLKKSGYEVIDASDTKLDPNDDFPIFAKKVVNDVLSSDDQDPRGVLLCGSGQGMCMAANRHKGIRAALGFSVEAAKVARNDDDSNVLCLPADVLERDITNKIVEAWLNTPFEKAPRFLRRIKEMDEV